MRSLLSPPGWWTAVALLASLASLASLGFTSDLSAQELALDRRLAWGIRFGCAPSSALARAALARAEVAEDCPGEPAPPGRIRGWIESRADSPLPGSFEGGWTSASSAGTDAALTAEGVLLHAFDVLSISAGARVDDEEVRPRLRVDVETESLALWAGSIPEPPPMLPGLVLSRRPRGIGGGGRWDVSWLSVGGALGHTDREDRWYLDGVLEGRYGSWALTARRATLFDDRPDEPITLRRVLQMLVGRVGVEGKSSNFENSLASLTLAYRGRPWAGEIEWGTEDLSGAYVDVPGLRARIDRWLGAWTLGTEVTWIDRSCCGNPPWYRHQGIPEGWTAQAEPLGAALGGNGHQLRVELGRVDGSKEAAVLVRRRDAENIFAPRWGGTSVGVEGFWSVDPRWAVLGGLEAGSGWTSGRLGLKGRW